MLGSHAGYHIRSKYERETVGSELITANRYTKRENLYAQQVVLVAVVVVLELVLLLLVILTSSSPILLGHGLPDLYDSRISSALRQEAIAGEVATSPVVVNGPVTQADPAKIMQTLHKPRSKSSCNTYYASDGLPLV